MSQYTNYTNQTIDIDNFAGHQCFDWSVFVARLQLASVGKENAKTFYPSCFATGGVADWGNDPKSKKSWIDAGFIYEQNNPRDTNQVPPAGAIFVKNKTSQNQWGHTGVVLKAQKGSSTFYSLDQNTGSGDGEGYDDRVVAVTHDYNNLLGWFYLPSLSSDNLGVVDVLDAQSKFTTDNEYYKGLLADKNTELAVKDLTDRDKEITSLKKEIENQKLEIDFLNREIESKKQNLTLQPVSDIESSLLDQIKVLNMQVDRLEVSLESTRIENDKLSKQNKQLMADETLNTIPVKPTQPVLMQSVDSSTIQQKEIDKKKIAQLVCMVMPVITYIGLKFGMQVPNDLPEVISTGFVFLATLFTDFRYYKK